MKFIKTKIPDVIVIEPTIFNDSRGSFQESYHIEKFKENGISLPFVQDNIVTSTKDVLRGLHFQVKHPQGKLVRAVSGEVLDIAVDIRKESPFFGMWVGEILSNQNQKQIYVPPGFAHGYLVLSQEATVLYKCTDIYYPEDDSGIIWNDEKIGIEWGINNPILSEKDKLLSKLVRI